VIINAIKNVLLPDTVYDTIYSGDFDKCKVYDLEATMKLIEYFIDSSIAYLEDNKNKKMKIFYNDKKVMNYINKIYKNMIDKYKLILYLSKDPKNSHWNHIHIEIYNKK